jgi:hypothetical protein
MEGQGERGFRACSNRWLTLVLVPSSVATYLVPPVPDQACIDLHNVDADMVVKADTSVVMVPPIIIAGRATTRGQRLVPSRR